MHTATDITVAGARTNHDIDVLVTFKHIGLDLMWVVECKQWKASVSKAPVLALRQIVEDTGADRGILLAEGGFQSGAYKAAEKSNTLLTSLADLRKVASEALNHQKLLSFPLRIAQAHTLYWSLSKSDRIALGIRSDHWSGDRGYLGQLVLPTAQEILLSALANRFPPQGQQCMSARVQAIRNLGEAISWLEEEVSGLESRLTAAPADTRRRRDL